MSRIAEIRMTGRGQLDAMIRFNRGPNVVSGDSDTGKSYLARLVDYVLGADELKKAIDEAADYETVWLEFRNAEDEVLTLERSLQGGEVLAYSRSICDVIGDDNFEAPRPDEERVRSDDNQVEILASKRQGRSVVPDVTSRVFPFFGLPETVTLRKNAGGETQRLSIRTMLPIFLVDENDIITEGSPILRGGFGDTAEKRMFSYLLTGKDDASIVAQEKREIVSARLQAQRDLLADLIAPLNARLKERKADEEEESINRLEDTITRLSEALERNAAERSRLQSERGTVYQSLVKSETQVVALDAMLTRYRLLDERYLSDLQRLDFIAEGSYYLDGLQTNACPLCGQSLEGADHDHPDHLGPKFSSVEVYASASAEAAKIRGLQADLQNAISDLRRRRDDWKRGASEDAARLQEIDRLQDAVLAPARQQTKASLDDVVKKRLDLQSARADRSEAAKLERMKAELEKAIEEPQKKLKWAPLDPMATTELCKEIEAVLRDWSWKDDVRVEFEESQYDIKVNGKVRRAHGKGFRAVLHAAISVALLRYCRSRGKPHPGFIVLDSPLTTVKQGRGQTEVEADDGRIEPMIEPKFWESLASVDPYMQIIVLDNKEPPPELADKLNLQIFAGLGAKPGERRGFIPDRATNK
ncbi:hypothetical protein EN837_03455 [bacterium M00.F.Ca.ET.194.01.1.1]|uniref:hypothetical protein n=2 Tax=Hyphomicrobiales TaxID=356 RepID=UPI001092200C|nr:hypothetical protein [Agrobacterium pusense]TGR72415.1 hypothetical protein EN837_03455 [bacterium M00.F.Ca.ET.194.01.1.1]TGS57316.1 hypothetical protein EN822_03455 [bacterium M00.F.Ca.ET.179.01.1.1]TGV50247.1 hypothetical protein EN811_03455 [bacterium M00.F.Ca.ET.168.01.1.1]